MRKLVTVGDDALARRLADALLAESIATEVRDDDPEQVEVWVRDDADVPEARTLSDRFLEDPDAFGAKVRAGAKARSARQAADRRWRQRVERTRHSVHGVRARPVFTMAIGVAALAVTLLTSFGQHRAMTDLLVLTRYPARAGLVDVMNGEVWRLVTPALLHFDVMHLAFNLWMWWSFGRLVEERKGPAFFLPLVLVADVAGFVGEWLGVLWTTPGGFAYAGGLSGILYGLFGYVWLKGRLDPSDRLEVHPQTVMLLLGWLLLGFSGMLGVANGAHLAGLVVGLLWALGDIGWFRLRRRLDRP